METTEKNALQWLRQQLRNTLRFFSWYEQHELEQFVLAHWDAGAARTAWYYYKDSERQFLQLLEIYYDKYYDKMCARWKVWNPSAAAVALIRERSVELQ